MSYYRSSRSPGDEEDDPHLRGFVYLPPRLREAGIRENMVCVSVSAVLALDRVGIQAFVGLANSNYWYALVSVDFFLAVVCLVLLFTSLLLIQRAEDADTPKAYACPVHCLRVLVIFCFLSAASSVFYTIEVYWDVEECRTRCSSNSSTRSTCTARETDLADNGFMMKVISFHLGVPAAFLQLCCTHWTCVLSARVRALREAGLPTSEARDCQVPLANASFHSTHTDLPTFRRPDGLDRHDLLTKSYSVCSELSCPGDQIPELRKPTFEFLGVSVDDPDTGSPMPVDVVTRGTRRRETLKFVTRLDLQSLVRVVKVQILFYKQTSTDPIGSFHAREEPYEVTLPVVSVPRYAPAGVYRIELSYVAANISEPLFSERASFRMV